MRILIVSDSHGDRKYIDQAIERVEPDMICHLGDAQGDDIHIQAMGNCPLYIVRGNCDSDLSLPLEETFDLEGHRVLMAHGHYFGGSPSTIEAGLRREAEKNHCDIIMYGHTHIPVLREDPDLTILNPGSIARPRQDGRKHSYIVLEITKKGDFLYNLCSL
ncbi:metallophosphoesterase family protein [Lachnospiraceae bacterium YH-ros2228]